MYIPSLANTLTFTVNKLTKDIFPFPVFESSLPIDHDNKTLFQLIKNMHIYYTII